MLLGITQQCIFGLILLAPGVYTQPEAPYPDAAGWLPLTYEHTADGYDNHDEHYANKGECLPGSTVQLRGHVQCVSGNQEWCVSWINSALFSDSAPFRRAHLTRRTRNKRVMGRVYMLNPSLVLVAGRRLQQARGSPLSPPLVALEEQ